MNGVETLKRIKGQSPITTVVMITAYAQEAIKTFSKRKYGIILLDIKLDGEAGMDVAEAIKKQGYKCAIILMSAYKNKFQPLLDKAGQINNFMEKPFEINDILKLLNEISRKRLKEALAA